MRCQGLRGSSVSASGLVFLYFCRCNYNLVQLRTFGYTPMYLMIFSFLLNIHEMSTVSIQPHYEAVAHSTLLCVLFQFSEGNRFARRPSAHWRHRPRCTGGSCGALSPTPMVAGVVVDRTATSSIPASGQPSLSCCPPAAVEMAAMQVKGTLDYGMVMMCSAQSC